MSTYDGFHFDNRIHAADALALARLVTRGTLLANKMEASRLCLGLLGNATHYVEVVPMFAGTDEDVVELAEEIEHAIAMPKGIRGWLEDSEFVQKILRMVWKILQDLEVFV